jgi:RHH-type rel operon transcriptional repressor/antitoxin RelB
MPKLAEGKQKLRPITFRIDTDTDERLNRLARETHRDKSFYLREALEEYLSDLEDIYLAEKRLEDVRAGRTRTFTLDEVEARLDLGD